MEIHTLELPKIPQDSDGTALWKWLRFISSETREELASLAGKDTVMTEALMKLLDMSTDLATRRRAESRAKWLWDQSVRERTSREKGLAEGLAEGLAKGLAKGITQVARRMLRAKMPVADIAKLTDCPVEEIERLAAETE